MEMKTEVAVSGPTIKGRVAVVPSEVQVPSSDALAGFTNRPSPWVSSSNSSDSQDALSDSLCSSPVYPRTLPTV